MLTTDAAYRSMLRNIIDLGEERPSRNGVCLEILSNSVVFDMNSPFITLPRRKVSLSFAVKEAEWILSGRNDIFHPNLKRYSDDGVVLTGAYGPKVVQQIDYVINTLRKDPWSRQAVMTIWERNPSPSKDIPCTVGLQFILRDSRLFTTVFMRSSDAWLGFPYDLFSFSMISLAILQGIGCTKLGSIAFMLGSSHIYETDLSSAADALEDYISASRHCKVLNVASIINDPRNVKDILADCLATHSLESIFKDD